MTTVQTVDGDIVAANFIGNVQGNVTGAVLGNVTGNLTGNVTGNITGNTLGGVLTAPTVQSGDGAISIPSAQSIIAITKGSAAALTIAAPTSGTDDGKTITFYSETAFSHVLTCSTDGFNDKGSSGTVTLGGAIGDGFTIRARLGHWYVYPALNATAA